MIIGFNIGLNSQLNKNNDNILFLISDMNLVSNGYFIGTGIKVSAETTTILNDSFKFPANNQTLIKVLTDNGIYSDFYVDDNTPRKIVWSTMNSIYGDVVFFDLHGNNDLSAYKKPIYPAEYESAEYESTDYITL